MLEYKMDPLPGSYHYIPTLNDSAYTFPFCCMETGEFIMGDQYYTKRDNNNSLLLIITTEGCGKMTYKDHTCILDKGSAVLIDCRYYQEYATLPDHFWHFFYIHFTTYASSGYCNLLTSSLVPIKLRSFIRACELMKQLHDQSHTVGVLSYATQSNMISDILTEMVCSLSNDQDQTASITRNEITKLAEYIRENCTEQLHLEDFTQFSSISKYHLIREFNKQIGIPPYKYMHLCRINRSQNLLRTTTLTITEIAYEVGYKDPVVFNRHFRAFNNLSPGEYRRNSIILSAKNIGVPTLEG